MFMKKPILTKITVETLVDIPVETVWEMWTRPDHIVNWNFASEDWECPRATNDLRVGKGFVWRMEAKDGSAGFDFCGTYDKIIPLQHLAYGMEDGRRVEVVFESIGNTTKITESFDAEDLNSAELQRKGWQAILENFKQYAESRSKEN